MPQAEKNDELGFIGQVNLVVLLLILAADPVLPYVRRPGTLGERFFSLYTALAVCAMFLFIAQFNDRSALPVLCLTCLMFLLHRVARRWQPVLRHSQSGGISWFRGKYACVMKEPLCVGMTGFAFLSFGLSKGLGIYLMVAAIGLFLGHCHVQMRIASQTRQMTDSRIAAEMLRTSFEAHTRRKQ